MKLTINTIAEAAGVSKSTVSKVINNHPSISQETKEKVRSIMKELNYTPNSLAKNLAQKSSYNIAVLIDVKEKSHFTNPFFYNLLSGVESVIFESRYELTICNINFLDSSTELLNRYVYSKKADGIILPSLNLDIDLMKLLIDINYPCVFIGQPDKLKNASWVDINNTVAGELATTHLLEQGYKRIAIIGGKNDEIISNNRIQGYKNIITRSGNARPAEYILQGNGTENSGYQQMKELLNMKNPPDSIVCVNNFIAFGVLKAIQESGLRVPEDIGLVAFDNYPLAPYTSPPISVLDIDTFDLGVSAAKILMHKIEDINIPNQCEMLTPGLIIRKSSQKNHSK